jgi:hypothetical protein
MHWEREALTAEFNDQLTRLNARAEELFAKIRNRLPIEDRPVFEPPEAEVDEAEDDDPLYDSNRDYDEQLEGYRRERGRFRLEERGGK